MKKPESAKPESKKPDKEVALAFEWPTFEELLIAKGLTSAEAKAKLAELFKRFPSGVVPESLVYAWIDSVFSASLIQQKLMEAVFAAHKVYSTGKGPVAPTSPVQLA